MEQEHVYKVYNHIAKHFSETRYSQWNSVKQFLDSLPPNSVVLDIGCGNGKNMLHRPHLHFIGSDITENLLEQANKLQQQQQQQQSENPNLICSSILNLPFRHAIADAVICIAVIHHLSSQQLRKQALQEIINTLTPGGKAHITVWMENQPKKQKWTLLDTPGDYFIPWTDKHTQQTLNRYYHFFTAQELLDIIPPHCSILDLQEECYNYSLTIEKSKTHPINTIQIE